MSRARIRFSNKRRFAIWDGLGPTPRLIVGALLIVVIGLIGMTPKEIGGFPIPWPYAALWGAVGWGRVGIALRPMLLLILFGLAQDIGFNAPLGCFAVLNLTVYGLSSAISDTLDDRQPLVAFIVPMVLFIAAFIIIWTLASVMENHPAPALKLLTTLLFTGALYGALHPIFDLGRRPGQLPGKA